MERECSVRGCGRRYESKGFCKSHAQRIRSGKAVYCACGNPIPLARGSHLNECLDCKNSKTCSECESHVFQKGYCQTHYMRWYRGRLVAPICIRCGEATGKELHVQKYCNECLPIRLRELSARRASRERAAYSEPYERISIYALDNGICYLCQEIVAYEQAHLDHVVPISLGGDDAEYNVAMTHGSCNRRKSAIGVNRLNEKFPLMKVPERIRL